jgi:ABC-type nitrate/sulfonate/bicarbonate transport system substrate-binding protein
MNKTIRLLLAATLLSLMAPSDSSASQDEIRIGWQPAPFFEFFLAKQEEMFKQAGLKPTFVKFLAGPPMLAALKSGDIDVTFGGMPPFVYGLAADLDISIFLWTYTLNLVMVVQPDSGINSVDDLADKTIATVMGSSAHYTILEMLRDRNVPLSRVQILNMQIPSILPAFTNRQIPAVIIWEPWGVKLTSAGGKRVGPYSGYTKYSQTAIYYGRRQWMKDNPETMQKFIGVIDRALELVRKDPKPAATLIANEMALDQGAALDILRLGTQTYVSDLREPLDRHPLAMRPRQGQVYSGHVEALAQMAEFLQKNGNIKMPITRERLTASHSLEFLEAYLKTRGQ